jgi:cation:H+ antiporter
MTYLALIGGLLLLVLGGELLVRGSVRVAERLGISPLLIGLTLVGFGTSAPELVTSVQAALLGSPDIAVGNIVGSNLANILLILGIAVLIAPVAVQSAALKRDGGFVLVTACLFAAAGWTVGLVRPVGLAFIMLLIGYVVLACRQELQLAPGRSDHSAAFDRAEANRLANPVLRPRLAKHPRTKNVLTPLLIALSGLAIIVLGGRLLVSGAVELARLLGFSEAVIGLTVVAVGTSMPELVTAILAASKRQADVAFGNVLGSNLYNTLGIGGSVALLSPTPMPREIIHLDSLLVIAASSLLLLFAWTGWRLSRREGGSFVLLYLCYMGWLILTSQAS